MKYVYIVLLLTTTVFSIAESIANGSFVSIQEVPYYVSLVQYDGNYTTMCGGTIISEQWIVSAGHCIDWNPSSTTILIRTGTTTDTFYKKENLHDVERVILYGEFYQSPISFLENDIALIKIKKPMVFNEFQQPIRIASEPPQIGQKMLLAGFGHQGRARGFPSVLKETELHVLDKAQCEIVYGDNSVSDTSFCAGDESTTDSCNGDSGGPCVIEGKLAGIVSWGAPCQDYTNSDESAAVYTRVHKFYDWIIKHTGIKY